MALINRTEFDGPNRKGEDVKAPLEAPLCFPTSLDKTTSEEEADLPNHNTQYVFLWINLGDADVKGRRTHNSSYRDIGRGVGVSVIDLDVLNANQRIDSGEKEGKTSDNVGGKRGTQLCKIESELIHAHPRYRK